MTLLEQIWDGGQGQGCLMLKKGNGRVQHEFFQTAPQAENRATVLSAEGYDVWFAPALFNQTQRKQEHVASIKALWLDVDCGPGKDYATRVELDNALEKFAERVDLPEPCIVESGNGLHLYWIFDQPLDRDTWHRLATKLKNACQQHDFKADHGVTCDSARVLRVPGTFNYKDPANPKPVSLVSFAGPYNVERLHGALSSYDNKLSVSKDQAKKINAKFAVDLPSLPKDANKIADECAQMRLMRDTKGNIPEPQWYAGLGVLALCENGEELAHEWSRGHRDYNQTATADKFERSREFAPTTCERFRSVAPSLCSGCPHAARISSPIQLGEYIRPAVAKALPDGVQRETTEDQKVDVSEGLQVPKFYEVGDSGVWFNPPKSKEDDDPKRQLICFNPLWVVRVMLDPAKSSSEVEILYHTPHGEARQASFKHELLARPSDMNAWLKSYNIGVPPKGIEPLIFYLLAGIQLYNQTHREQTVYSQFGWHNDDFIVGQDKITPQGIAPANISMTVDGEKLKRLAPIGSLDKWIEATAVLDKPEYWPHRFAVCTMLASPLLRLTKSRGSVLALSGESGAGKSAGAVFGLSAFGHPESLIIDPESTENSFYNALRVAGSLPVLCDEAVTMAKKDEARLSRIIYAAANGKARDAMNRDGTQRKSGRFFTITCFTNNTHLLALPERILNDATRKRIFELTFGEANKMPLSDGTVLYEAAEEHCGQAGRVFLKYVVENRKALLERYKSRLTKLASSIGPANHYNLWLINAASLAYEVAHDLGLIKFGFTDAMRNALDLVSTRDRNITPTTVRVQESVTRYLQQFQGFITQKHTGKKGTWIESVIVRGEVRARYTVELDKTFTLCLPVKQFSEWALERNIDINHIEQWATEKGIPKKLERIAPKTDAVWCWIIKGYTVDDYEEEGINDSRTNSQRTE